MLERGVPQRGERRRLGSSSMCHREARTDPVAADEPTAHYRRQTYRTRLGSSHSAPDYGAEPRRKVHVAQASTCRKSSLSWAPWSSPQASVLWPSCWRARCEGARR
jgi:hypothetical protein